MNKVVLKPAPKKSFFSKLKYIIVCDINGCLNLVEKLIPGYELQKDDMPILVSNYHEGIFFQDEWIGEHPKFSHFPIKGHFGIWNSEFGQVKLGKWDGKTGVIVQEILHDNKVVGTVKFLDTSPNFVNLEIEHNMIKDVCILWVVLIELFRFISF